MKAIKNLIKSILPNTYEQVYIKYRQPSRYRNLYSTIKRIKPKKILEVGTWNGKRAIKMIEEAKRFNKDISYYGFDLFEDLTEEKYISELSKRPPSQKNVEESLLQTGANISLYKGDTISTLKDVEQKVGQVDFVYIDGGHSVETIKSDWENIKKVMHENTVVIFDDYWRNRTDGGCKTVVDAIDNNLYDVELLPEVNVFNNKDFGRLEISYARVTRR